MSDSERTLAPSTDGGELQTLLGVRVLGMHRSGTSFVAGCLARSGFFVGDESRMLPATAHNPFGYFERDDVVALDNRMLAAFGASWWNPPLRETVQGDCSRWVAAASEVLESVHLEAGVRPCVLKDPRMAMLMPVWDQVLGHRFLDVFVLRNPIDIALSLMHRDGFPVQFSLALWELHMVSILAALRDRQVVTVNFSGIAPGAPMASLPDGATAVFRRAGLPAPRFDGFVAAARHFSSADADLFSLGTPSQLRLWGYLSTLAPVEDPLTVPDEFLTPPVAATTLVREVGRLLDPHNTMPGLSLEAEQVTTTQDEIRSAAEVDRTDELLGLLAEAHRANGVLQQRLSESDDRLAVLSLRLAQRAEEIARLDESNASLRVGLDRVADEFRAKEDSLLQAAAALRTELERSNAVVTELRARTRAMRAENESLRSRFGDVVAAFDESVAARADLEVRARAFEVVLGATSERLQAERETGQSALREVEHTLAAVLASRSWRVTRPLRALVGAIRGRRRR